MKLDISVEERIVTGLFLCADKPNEILGELKPEWNDKSDLSINEKLLIINPPAGPARSSLSIQNIFPWKDELSHGIDHEEFCKSFFMQPDLFLRLRPGREKIVMQKLQHAKIDFAMISETCLSLPNSSKIDEIIEIDNEAVIQDYNSQQTGRFLGSALATPRNDKFAVWDCCAGSGGKSIMVYDIDPNNDLIVSDVRESILSNLKKRFEKAGIKKYRSFKTDLTSEKSEVLSRYLSGLKPEIIIADVPCTGSGTWSRTPEQLYFFDESKIETYSVLQKKIVSNAIPQLQPGGVFIYITCSVFKKENEEVVTFVKENFHLQLIQMEVLKGYDMKADSMFVAVLSLPKH